MPRKNSFDYFECFVSMAACSCQAADMLMATLERFDPGDLSKKMLQMHEIEHREDVKKHELLRHLVKEFISPIEREDIMTLAQALDDVTDAIEDVLMRMYMFRVDALSPRAKDFGEVIVQCCQMQQKMMEEFRQFRKSKTIKDCVVEINRLEEVADQLYTQAMYDLFSPDTPPMEALAWKEVFDCFEKCCDACEDVADVVESVMMKNS